jgi:ubiquinone/menaquinone biosynthesis C-methylase UbiE
VELVQGNAERLPFREGIFDRILNAGAINFYNDPQAAMDEMVRVAAAGAKVVIADESERGAKGYEKTIPGFTSSFEQGRKVVRVPRQLVPEGMLDVTVSEIWKGWFYCLEFRKP